MKKMKSRRPTRILSVCVMALFVGLVGCDSDDDITGIGDDDVVGAYAAITFTVNEGGDITNLILGDGEFILVLEDDGTLTGTLLAPNMADDGSDISEDLTGTWDYDDLGGEVTLEFESELLPGGLTVDAGHSPAVEGAIQLDGEEDYGDYSVALIMQQSIE